MIPLIPIPPQYQEPEPALLEGLVALADSVCMAPPVQEAIDTIQGNVVHQHPLESCWPMMVSISPPSRA